MNNKKQTILIVCSVLLAFILVVGVIWQNNSFSESNENQNVSETYTLQDGINCFRRGEYAKAKDILSRYSGGAAAGYIGMMQMYGLGGYQHNVAEARKNLELAPNTTPFLVPKADLTLILDLYENYGQATTVNRAKDLYEIALSERPEDKAVMLKLKALKGIAAASDHWDNYSFTNDNGIEGRYSGQIQFGNNWEKYAHGWGGFAWDDHSSCLGKFSRLKLNGSGIRINRHDYTDHNEFYFTFYIGEFRNDELVEGVMIDENGKQHFGTFKNGSLVSRAEVRDVLGNVQ